MQDLKYAVRRLLKSPGFNRENVLIFTLTQPGSKAPTNDHRVRFTRAILEHLAQIPGVSRVGEVSSTPMNGTALALACVGIYGVMAYSVAQRTREMGIRLALGADARKIVSLILRDGLRIVAIGLGLGTLGSLGASVLIYSQLYNATTSDPIVVSAVVALVLLSVALFACWLPARRATRVDPLVALRAE